MRRLGIFAGSFDPIHDGHLEVARQCIDLLDLETVYFMVEDESWGSKSPVKVEYRREMVEIAASSDIQLQQLVPEESRFTIDETLARLESDFSGCELYFVVGADVFVNMSPEQWPGLEKLLDHYIVVFERSAIDADDIQDKAKELGVAVAVFPSPHPEHSSTDVRMNPHQKDIWVQPSVAKYIDENGLYSVADSSEV